MTDRERIHATLDLVRRRWRLRLALEALVPLVAVVVGALLVWILIWPLTAERPAAIATARWLAALVVATVAVVLGVRWRRRRPNDGEVALYVEERAPALNQALVSTLSTESNPDIAPGLADRVLASARDGLKAIDDGRHLERERLRRAGGLVGALTLGSVALIAFGPTRFRDATSTLVNPWKPVATAPTFMVAVTPGNAEVPKGGGVDIAARLTGFGSESAELVFRADSAPDWERVPMSRDTASGKFTSRMFDLAHATDYFVEAHAVRSPVFRLTVVDLPAVGRTSATIQLPGYTGLAPESVEDVGDLAVLQGSTVTLHATTTRPAKSAYLVVEGRQPVPMTRSQSGAWTGAVKVSTDVFWRIDLDTDDGRRVTGLQYAIDALDDAAPSVRFTAPGRDTKVTSIEEVTTQVEATDDYGVRRLVLHASVNGGTDQPVILADTGVKALKDLSAAHTFFLEEFSLKPGDLVSYYAEAVDGAGHAGKSDIYFLEVRPFDRTYREAEQRGAGGQGGGESAEGLSERQRQIVVGTFNVLRDSLPQANSYRENVTTLAIGEGRLRSDVANLNNRLHQRQMMAIDSTFLAIARELDSAATELTGAEEQLGRQRPREALPPAQKALQHLQRAEAAYREIQVAQGNQQGGGGGASRQQKADELADLFELETDKLKNQYESVQRESGQQAEKSLDETLERLRRLASRQEQENERMQRMADAFRNRSAQGGGGGGGGQRQLAQETEAAARQLERLARERNNQGMADAARRLKEAADQMRRAAGTEPQNGAAQGGSALEQLRNATKQIERSRAEGRQQEIKQLQTRAEAIRDKQKEVADQANGLPADPGQRGERLSTLGARKDALARDVERLEADADRLSKEAAREQPKTARKLGEAAEGLRANRVRDKLVFSKDLLNRASPEYLKNFEQQIGENLGEAARQLREAAGAIEESGDSRQSRALERARDLVKGLESLNERARAAQRSGGTARGGEQREGKEGGQQPGQPGGKAEGQQGGEGKPGQSGDQPSGERRGERQQGEGKGAQPNGPPGSTVPGDTPNGPAGRADNDGLRQFGREFRARRQAAESLRADLRAIGQDTRDIDKLLDQFRTLDNQQTFGDIRGLDRLQSDLIDGLKDLEFSLWRRFGEEGGQRPAAGASARVPPQYRELVEEYYRSLSKQRPVKP